MKKHFTVEKIILYLAAGFAAYNFGLAGGYIEGTHFSAGGLIAGLVVNISIAIAASRYGSLNGKKRTRQAQIAFVAMLFLSPLLVSPVIFYSLPDTFLEVSWLRAVWSIGWALVADLAIVLAGAVSGKGLIHISEGAEQSGEDANEGAATTGAVRKQKKSTANALRELCVELDAQYACTEPQCEWSPGVDALLEKASAGGDPKRSASSAKAGHVKNQHAKPIAIDESLLIRSREN